MGELVGKKDITMEIVYKNEVGDDRKILISFEKVEGKYHYTTETTIEFLEDICSLFETYGIKASIH